MQELQKGLDIFVTIGKVQRVQLRDNQFKEMKPLHKFRFCQNV